MSNHTDSEIRKTTELDQYSRLLLERARKLDYLLSLMPSAADFAKYGLTEQELIKASGRYFDHDLYDMVDICKHLQLAITILKKNRIEKNPPIQAKDLAELLTIITDDIGSVVTTHLLLSLRDKAVIIINVIGEVIYNAKP